MKRMIWICGWASDLSIWQAEISEQIKAEHIFVAFDQWFGGQELPEGDLYILWSMGFYALSKLPTPDARVLALFPAIHFCGPNGWAPRILQRMIKQLKANPKSTLESFAEQMLIPSDELNKWVQRASLMDPMLLESGLEALLTQPQINGVGFDILSSPIDRICPSAQCQIDDFAGQHIEIHGPHWPIHPDTLIAIRNWVENCL